MIEYYKARFALDMVFMSWHAGEDFRDVIMRDERIMMNWLDRTKVHELFNMDYHTKHIDYIFNRIGL